MADLWKKLLLVIIFCCSCFSLQAAQPQRIISIDGSITEIIYSLGAEQNLVAVDTTSQVPAAARELPDVGYMRRLSVEGILSMQPDLIITSTDAGPELVFEQLRQAGVRVERIKTEYSLKGVLHKVGRVAEILGKEAEGKALKANIKQQAQDALARIPANAEPVKTLFLLGGGKRGLMAAGKNTQPQALLDMLGAENVMSHQSFKPISAEGATLSNPQVVLVTHTAPGNTEALQHILTMTDAQKNQRIHSLNTGLILGFGPRIGIALQQLVVLLYPDPAVVGTK